MRTLQPYIDKAAILVEALPYIQAFRDKTVVIKYGGSIGSSPEEDVVLGDAARCDTIRNDTVLGDIVFMEHVGINPVIVHGGGPAIDRRLGEEGIETLRVNGLRVTDAATMRVVEETLSVEVNAGIVEELNHLGGKAAGVSAKEAAVMHVRKHMALAPNGERVDIGYVGDVERIDPEAIEGLIASGVIPVIAPIGLGPGGEAYNVNADTAAGEIAAGLQAEKLVFLTDVMGIMRNPADDASLLSTVNVDRVDELLQDGTIAGGMIPKVRACVRSVKAGVRKTHVVDGRIPHSMLLEFFTDEGIGTQIVQ